MNSAGYWKQVLRGDNSKVWKDKSIFQINKKEREFGIVGMKNRLL